MRVVALTPALGAEIHGLDLRETLSDALLAELRRIWLERLVVVFKGQTLEPAQQMAFARRWGEPDRYPFLKGLDGFPEITEVLKREHETVNFGGLWHADTTYQRCPPMATMLYALELPPVGGDTLFADQRLAFETLSEGLRKTLAGLRAIASAAQPAVSATRSARVADQGTEESTEAWRAVHPVVRRHPETGRPSLFVNPAHTIGFEGWSEADSRPLLEHLFHHQVSEAFTCRLRWQPGDLALWDNRAVLHYPLNDYHGHRRRLHRITLKGDEPRPLI
ncbi:MAG: TauD/TfdA family dioxygenase [Burkholderiaceae bacterium]